MSAPESGEGRRRGKMRSFVLGGVLGASVAAGLRRSRRRRRRSAQVGLAAFESAPCYRELTERNHRDGP